MVFSLSMPPQVRKDQALSFSRRQQPPEQFEPEERGRKRFERAKTTQVDGRTKSKSSARSQSRPGRHGPSEEEVDAEFACLTLPEKERQLFIVKQNLQVEREYTLELQQQLKAELEKVQQHREDLKMLETDMNQQKLKMLIKFDKIKYLEDFYNSQRPEEQIHLDVEVDQQEMVRVAEKVFRNHCLKARVYDQKRLWAIQGLQTILQSLMAKRHQTPENKARYSLLRWKLAVMKQDASRSVADKRLVLNESKVMK